MFERFTDRARRVVVLAQEEARMLDHNYIGTEHLLLGLVAEGEGVGAKALEHLGVGLLSIREEVLNIIGRGGGDVTAGHIPFTPRAKRVLELALRESLRLNHHYIGTEHVLLALLREGEGVAAQILLRITPGLDAVRETVIELLMRHGHGTVAGPSEQAGILRVESFSPGLRAALDVAAARHSGTLVGSQHVLSVFAEWDDLAASKVLAAGGFDASRVGMPIADWPAADTRDESPQQRAMRVTELTLEGDALTITIKDPALRDRIAAALATGGDGLREAFGRVVRDL